MAVRPTVDRAASARDPSSDDVGGMDSTAVRHLAHLAEVSRLLGTSLDYQLTINESLRALVPSFADVCSVFVDEGGLRVRVAQAGVDRFSATLMHELGSLPIPVILSDLVDEVLCAGRARLIADYRELVRERLPADDPYLGTVDRLEITQVIIAPVFVRGQSAGAFTVGMVARTGRAFETLDTHFAEELADRIGLAIDNARLYGKAEAARRAVEQREASLFEERRTFEALYRIGTSLATELDAQKLVQRVTDEATQLTGASFGSFCRARDTDDNLEECSSCGVPLGSLSDVPQKRKSTPLFCKLPDSGVVRSDDIRKDPRFAGDRDIERSSITSYLAVPVVTRTGDLVGGLCFGHPEASRFTKEHEQLVTGIAGQASIALENARLYAQLRKSEANAHEAIRAAREAERRKDDFLAMLGHELRNPLAPIVTALELMRLRGVTGREAQIIERQTGHLVRLVDDLLDVARIKRGKIELKRQRVELSQIVARAVEITTPLMEQRQHHLETDVPPGLVVYGDTTRLAQIVSNILANAAKYTDRGGRIEIRGWRESSQIALSVRDNGPGIDAHALPKIFEPFVQTPQASDRAQGGLGIGLTLVRSLAALHGGRVEAKSEGAGRGSEFVVHLPAAADVNPFASSAAGNSASPARARGSLRILVVDDNADAASLLAEALRELGHDVATAEDGPTALQLAERIHPDIAVLDIGLPAMDGYELASELRRLNPAPSGLVAVTGYGQPEDRARGIEAGFGAHLVKPVDLHSLEQAIAAAQRRQ